MKVNSKFMLQETITTCKFAQRVSLIENEPRVIVEYDANQQLSLLKEKAVRLSSLTLNKKVRYSNCIS